MKNLKKIVMYIDIMAHGGAQRVMGNLAGYFVGQDIEVILINDFKLNDKEAQYTIDERVKREYLAEKNSGNLIVKNLKRIFKLRELIKKEKPDIVLSFLGRPNKRMLIATIGLNVKKVVSVRNDPNKEYGKSFLDKIVARGLFRFADGCIFQTKDAQNYFSRLVQGKSEIILNPVDESFYLLNKTSKTKDIISIGRLEAQKNNVLLIQAFKNIANKFPEENLIFYGSGSKLCYLKDMVKKLKMENKVFFAGDTDNVSEKLASCKIFALSSDYEGMPNALMEAMASGSACISTNCPCGGPQELITDNQNGILIPVNDVNKMSFALSKLLNDDLLRENLGRNAKERAEQFKAARVYAIWKNYFEKVLNG